MNKAYLEPGPLGRCWHCKRGAVNGRVCFVQIDSEKRDALQSILQTSEAQTTMNDPAVTGGAQTSVSSRVKLNVVNSQKGTTGGVKVERGIEKAKSEGNPGRSKIKSEPGVAPAAAANVKRELNIKREVTLSASYGCDSGDDSVTDGNYGAEDDGYTSDYDSDILPSGANLARRARERVAYGGGLSGSAK